MTAKKAKKEKLVVFCVVHKIFYFNNFSITEEKIVSSKKNPKSCVGSMSLT